LKIEVIVNGEKKSFNLVQLVNEPQVVGDGILGAKTEMVTMAYCYDKAHKPFKFPASQIERYD
jgi:hypothetical protein